MPEHRRHFGDHRPHWSQWIIVFLMVVQVLVLAPVAWIFQKTYDEVQMNAKATQLNAIALSHFQTTAAQTYLRRDDYQVSQDQVLQELQRLNTKMDDMKGGG